MDRLTIKAQPTQSQPGARSADEEKALTICPGCGTRRMVPSTFRGKNVRCPCGTTFLVEGAPATKPHAPSSPAPTPRKSSSQTAKSQSTTANTSGSLFDELTDGDMDENVKLQPLASNEQSAGGEGMVDAAGRQSHNIHALGRSKSKSRRKRSPSGEESSWTDNMGYVVFALLCGVPGLEMSGFGIGIPINFPIALACATIGGIVGGALICPRPIAAGLIGGAIAGPLGLLAVHYYTLPREEVWIVEITAVQMLASSPGFAVGYLIKKLMPSDDRS